VRSLNTTNQIDVEAAKSMNYSTAVFPGIYPGHWYKEAISVLSSVFHFKYTHTQSKPKKPIQNNKRKANKKTSQASYILPARLHIFSPRPQATAIQNVRYFFFKYLLLLTISDVKLISVNSRHCYWRCCQVSLMN